MIGKNNRKPDFLLNKVTYDILEYLYRFEKANNSKISACTKHTLSHTSKKINQLQYRGLVENTNSNKKTDYYGLTAKGKEIFENLNKINKLTTQRFINPQSL